MEELVGTSGFRGLALKEITPSLCLAIGSAISSLETGEYVVAHDVRLSSPLLALSLALGLNAGGSDVEYLGLAPTPALAYYARGRSGGAMVTASHNPPEYNGVKLFNPKGASITLPEYLKVAGRIPRAGHAAYDSIGCMRDGSGLASYVEAVAALGKTVKGWKVGLDPGNGSTTLTASAVYRRMGIAAQSINIAPDGSFPGRGPEPSEGALRELSEMVRARGLDIGFAFDGDGDRLAVVDERGRFVDPDSALAFFLAQSIKGGRGTVVVNVDTSAVVDFAVEAAGGRVVRTSVGDPYIVETMLRTNAVAGGEPCGAWIRPEVSLCPDGLLSSVILLSLLEEGGMRPSEVVEGLPRLYLRRKKLRCPNSKKRALMRGLEDAIRQRYGGEEFSLLDGIRVGFADKSWVLIRPSGTEPAIRITAEAPSERDALSLLGEFEKLIKKSQGG